MTDELETLVRFRPETIGPSAHVTARATAGFTDFLSNAVADQSQRRPPHRRRLVLAVSGVSLLLVALGGAATALFADRQSDGVVLIAPPVEATIGEALTLRVQESNLGTCIDVLTSGGSAGGCGMSLDSPMGVSSGGVGATIFLNGWVPLDTARIEVTLTDGTTIVVNAFETFSGYDVNFFAVLLDPTLGPEPPPAALATAYDESGIVVATLDRRDFEQTPVDHGPEAD